MNPAKETDYEYLVSPFANQKDVRDWIERHMLHNIAQPHDMNNCKDCELYRKITR